MSEPVTVYSAKNPPEAYLLKAALEDAGITAFVLNDNLQIASGELPLGWETAPKIQVAAEDAEAAKAILIEVGAKTPSEPEEE